LLSNRILGATLLNVLAASYSALRSALLQADAVRHVELALHSSKVFVVQNIQWLAAVEALICLQEILREPAPTGPAFLQTVWSSHAETLTRCLLRRMHRYHFNCTPRGYSFSTLLILNLAIELGHGFCAQCQRRYLQVLDEDRNYHRDHKRDVEVEGMLTFLIPSLLLVLFRA
jgi:hypothetical protein